MGDDHWNKLLGKVEGKRASTESRLGVRSNTQRWVKEPLKLGKMQKPAVRKNKTSLKRVGRIGRKREKKDDCASGLSRKESETGGEVKLGSVYTRVGGGKSVSRASS